MILMWPNFVFFLKVYIYTQSTLQKCMHTSRKENFKLWIYSNIMRLRQVTFGLYNYQRFPEWSPLYMYTDFSSFKCLYIYSEISLSLSLTHTHTHTQYIYIYIYINNHYAYFFKRWYNKWLIWIACQPVYDHCMPKAYGILFIIHSHLQFLYIFTQSPIEYERFLNRCFLTHR